MADVRRRDLRLLGALDALLSERNVTRAAARLNLSQSATSGTLAQLRTVFDDPLLVRVGRELELTARAREILPMLTQTMACVDSLFESQKPFEPGSLMRQFKLTVSDSVGQLLVPELIRRLSQLAPGVTLKVSAAGQDVPARMLGNGSLDLAVGHFEDVPADLRATTLYQNRLVAVVGEGHAASKGRITVRQLVSSPHVTIFPHSAALEDSLRKVFSTSRHPFILAASVQQLSMAMAIVEKIGALALVSEPMARLFARTLAIRILELPRSVNLPTVRVQAIWHERTHYDPAVRWLRDTMREVSRSGAA